MLVGYGGIAFSYDVHGTRISKGGVSFTYDSNGMLLAQSDGLRFIYDNEGVIGLKYNGSTNFYRKDIHGDIIAILDSTGIVVVEYVYSAWGNPKAFVLDDKGIAMVDWDKQPRDDEDSAPNPLYQELSQLNPFRYRGYYYDSETGLYFLKTRYYDPEVGRFITIDDISYIDPETINGLNLYAYCGNNPVMAVDPDGTMPKWLRWLIGGIIIVAAVALSIVTAGIATPICAALGGGLLGSIVGGAVAGAIGGAITSFAFSVASQGISKGFDDINWKEVGIQTAIGATIGAVVGGAMGGIQFHQAAKMCGSAGGRTPTQNMMHHFDKHVIKEGHKYLGKTAVQYTKNAHSFFQANSSLMNLTTSGNYMIRAIFEGHKAGGFFSATGLIYSFF